MSFTESMQQYKNVTQRDKPDAPEKLLADAVLRSAIKDAALKGKRCVASDYYSAVRFFESGQYKFWAALAGKDDTDIFSEYLAEKVDK